MSEKGALHGIRILDFTHVFQGPVGTQLLGDMGADVIKVERPGSGDWSRSWGPYIDGVSMPFASLNRSKRSLALNLKSDRGKEILLDLVKTADVLVHNFRPGTMERLGLDYESLKEVNPRLVYAVSTGWGEKGPYADSRRPGHDLMARAAAGWFFEPSPGEVPVPAGMSVDYPAGLMLMIGILAALAGRERTGRGQRVSTDLFSVALHAHGWGICETMNKERIQDSSGVGATERMIKKAFRTKDGLIEISPVFSQNALRDISEGLGLGDLSEDPRFKELEKREANAAELNRVLEEGFQQKTTADWLPILEKAGVLCGQVNTFGQAVTDPQAMANGMVTEMSLEGPGTLKTLGTPLRFTDTPESHQVAPPRLGENTREILAEMGLGAGEIDALVRDGVVATPEES
jgi:crotonobetainyl-CoA:carnitine CoA-transferase CaiB-like acyl-CoA transferase